ncbi:MAG: M16 family metallopeptidase [Opitutales bacterium]
MALFAKAARPYIREVLDNGLVVLHQPSMASGLVTAQVWFRTGSVHEGPLLGCGASHFLEHMLFKGSARRGPLDFAREVQAAGGAMNAYTTFERTVYYLEGPAENAAELFDILADLAFGASLPEGEFARERDVILREIAMGEDEPDRQLFRHFVETAFQRHPYRYPVIGHEELFKTLTHADLVDYYAGRYAPNNAALVIAGSLPPEEALTLAQANFGGVERRRLREAVYDREPPQLATREARKTGTYEIERGLMGLKIPGLASPEAPALEVLASILGQGQSSRLWTRLRDGREVVQHIETGCWNPGDTGLLFVSYTTDPGEQEAAEAAILEELELFLQSPPGADEVAKAVQRAVVGDLNSIKTVSGMASRLGAAEIVAGDADFPRRRLERLKAVDPAQVLEVARRYLTPGGLTSVSLGPPAQETGSPLVALGETPAFSEETRPNGAKLLWQAGGELPKVHVRVLWQGGPLLETPGLRGATGVLATLLTRDTAQRSAEDVARRVEQLGGSFQEVIGNNTFGLCIEVLGKDAAEAVDVLREAVLAPALQQERFDREREAQLAALREENDDVVDWARRTHRAAAFGAHPYAYDFYGTEADLEALDRAALNSLRGRLMVGGNCVMAVSGQFDDIAVLPALRGILDELPAGETPSVPAAPVAPDRVNKEIIHRDCEQAVVLAGYLDCGIQSEDYFASELLDELLSGMASRLFMRVREEQGLAYYVTAQRTVGLNCGLFTVYAGTAPEKVAEVEAAFSEELTRLAEGHFDEGEVGAARRRLVVRKLTARQSPGGRTMEAALDVMYGRGLGMASQYADKLEAVTPEALAARAQQLFSPENCCQLVVQPG